MDEGGSCAGKYEDVRGARVRRAEPEVRSINYNTTHVLHTVAGVIIFASDGGEKRRIKYSQSFWEDCVACELLTHIRRRCRRRRGRGRISASLTHARSEGTYGMSEGGEDQGEGACAEEK